MTAELQRVIESSLVIKEKYESPYVVYPPDGHTYIHDSQFCWDAADKLAVDKAIS